MFEGNPHYFSKFFNATIKPAFEDHGFCYSGQRRMQFFEAFILKPFTLTVTELVKIAANVHHGTSQCKGSDDFPGRVCQFDLTVRPEPAPRARIAPYGVSRLQKALVGLSEPLRASA
jgi:hypothetical protein